MSGDEEEEGLFKAKAFNDEQERWALKKGHHVDWNAAASRRRQMRLVLLQGEDAIPSRYLQSFRPFLFCAHALHERVSCEKVHGTAENAAADKPSKT